MNDFNSSVITLTFEADEELPIYEMNAPVPVTDDAINEATEQVFVVHLQLVYSEDPATVGLNLRNSSLCRIIDNDREYIITICNVCLTHMHALWFDSRNLY